MARERKDSGVEWIGEIPKDWELVKNKYIFNIKKAKLPSKFFDDNTLIPYMSMDYIRNPEIIPLFAKDGDFCSKNDILLLWDGSNAGEIIFNHPEGYAPSTTAILKLKKNIRQNFSQYYLKFFEKYLKKTVIGMGIPHVNGEILKNSIFLIPSLQEQEKIANYLDKEVADIDLIIEKTKTTIEDYKKYKQSIITEAVTKGLNPNVEMKDSGIEWIGQIPKHWKKINPKALFYQRKDRAKKDDRQLTASQKYGIMYQDEFMEKEGVRVTVVQKDFDILKHVEPNDFVISMRSFQGGLEYSELPGCISSAYVMLIPNLGKVYPKFFKFFFKSFKYINALQSTSNLVRDGQAMRYSNFSQLYLVEIPLEEQKEIAEYLDKKIAEIDNLIAKKESLISEMEEYKKSLIYECVTGKKEII